MIRKSGMLIHNKQFRFFRRIPWITSLLAAMIVANYALSVQLSGGLAPNVETLVRMGALTQWTISDGAYWRLAAAGFLHGSPIHLASNLLCLGAWGTILENRIGAVYFTVIFACSLVVGSFVSVSTHPEPFVGVGASGAIAGIFGALIGLAILGKLNLSVGFIVLNLLINVVLALKMPGIDWQAHLGGFTAGLAACACLDLLVKAGGLVFRCRFPEFVKVNAAILIGLACVWVAVDRPALVGTVPVAIVIAIACACALIALKLLDLLLVVKRGLLFVSVVFAVLNTVAVACFAPFIERLWATGCSLKSGSFQLPPSLDLAPLRLCPMPEATIPVLCAAAFIVTGIVYARSAIRGWRDVGFVAAGLMAEAKRSSGL